ncbi:MAG TPA: hypothetical protein VHJ20_03110 [Polyangia bacterium]|nr:hypothetical protein [Polyangia bacterium]
MKTRPLITLSLALAGGLAACSAPPSEPASPTWSDVGPILRGECTSCHGSTAVDTGGGYRFDFYEMSEAVCGDAAKAIPIPLLAGATATLIAADTAPTTTGDRPRMPPAPAPTLFDWERRTIAAWAAAPTKGPPPANNHDPFIQVGTLPSTATGRLRFTALIGDEDEEPVVGVIQAGGSLFAMNRGGTFAVDFDVSTWPTGTQRLSATLCDGWTHKTYDLGPVTISR